MQQNFLEDSLIILTKQTLDIFLKQENPSELIALYTFYYYTAKWQGTNQPKCTSDYVAKGLHWNRNKVARIKKQLLEFGLIEDVRIVDQETQRVKGYYIKMNYIFKKETLSKSQCIQNPPTGNEATKNEKASVSKIEGVENECTNALSTINLNALSTGNNINMTNFDEIENPSSDSFPPKNEQKNSSFEEKEQSQLKKDTTKDKEKQYKENFEVIWKMLKPHQNDRKKQVKPKRKKELYEMGRDRVEKAIKLYLKTQNPNYYFRRDNFFNEIIDNYIDKEESDFAKTNNGNYKETEEDKNYGTWL